MVLFQRQLAVQRYTLTNNCLTVLQENSGQAELSNNGQTSANGSHDTEDHGVEEHRHERYQVFHFDFDGVQAAYVVSLWIFIASIAKIGKFRRKVSVIW